MMATSAVLATFTPVVASALLGMVLLALVISVYRGMTRRATRQHAVPSTHDPEPSAAVVEQPHAASAHALAPHAFALSLRQAFNQAQHRVRANVAGSKVRGQLPRFLMLGEAASGKTTLLSNLGLKALGE